MCAAFKGLWRSHDKLVLVEAVSEARAVQMETEDTGFAIEWLIEHHPMTLESATRCLNDETLDHKDPEGPETLENIHLLCRRCNTLRGKRTWEEFQQAEEKWRKRLSEIQNARPDFICKRTGLSVKERSWKVAGCVLAGICEIAQECEYGGFTEFVQEHEEFPEYAEEQYSRHILDV